MRLFFRETAIFIAATSFLFVVSGSVGAQETVELANGETIECEILNPTEMPRKAWQLRIGEGVTVELANKKTVDRVVLQPQATPQYYARVPFLPESAETHVKLAEVCMSQKLDHLGKMHYERALELEPDNLAARQALNHRKIDGQWTTLENEMEQRGYVKDKRGNWTTPQKLLIDERRVQVGREHHDSSKTVQNLIARWKANPSQETENELYALVDPTAVPPLANALQNEPDPEFRDVLIRALSQIGTGPAWYEIANWAMREPNDDVCWTCIVLMQSSPGMAKFFTPYLTSRDNLVVNRAAYILGQLGDRTAIPPLINALITEHEVEVRRGDPNLSQYTGAGNNSFAGRQALKPEKANELVSNREVLVALRNLSGQDFSYDIPAWLDWWGGQNQITDFDARRGSYDR